ncbi:hypothetical protein [Chryseobacterium jejuense]|uniref:Uncharacterized protein n=1 Tax=Chryseobacterium jejuense TaxID=445960 RepID=A0A2X2X088_CHRJE|nr:hypothetical protein [Chryseobacterium jejuense]SDJ57334.1 hypothetical protein SAMN05421542_3852 [Chryseobacterium jejuense]SQB46154.1 Uncharacterised protein [Chryseobacterium jejuense]
MIKIETHTLAGQLDIEIKRNENNYFLLVIVSKSQYFKENGKVWNCKIMRTEKLFDIISLIKECYKKTSVPTKITILDGTLRKINLNDEESQIVLHLIDIDENTNESELLQSIKEFVNEVTDNDTTLQFYLDHFMG